MEGVILDTCIDIVIEMVYGALYRTLVARLANPASRRLDTVVGGPFHGSVRQCEAVALRLGHPLLHVVAFCLHGQCTHKLESLVQTMEEPLGRSLWHRHHKRQVAVGHHAYQHHELLWLASLAVCEVEGISRKVNLHLLSRLVVVVVRVVV